MKVAVVGAGISGLTAAWRLQQAGHDVVVFEASNHPGGRMTSKIVGDFELDLGVHMLLVHYDRTRALIEEMGLQDQWFPLVSGSGGVLRDQDLNSFSPGRAFDVLRFRGIHLVARVRLFVELARAHKFGDDLDFYDLSVGDDGLDEEDCETFSRRRMGDEATNYVVDCFIRTFHFHGAREMSVKYFEALAALLVTRGEFQTYSLRGHMRALPEALAARLDVRYESPVESVTSIERAGVRVQLAGQDRHAAPGTYDAVVVATTAEIARELLQNPSDAQRELLAHVRSSCTIVCSFAVPVEIAGDFEGIWVPYIESQTICAVSNETCKGSSDGERCVFSVFLHEEAASLWLARDDAEIMHAVAVELVRLFPRYADHVEPLFVQRWPAALPVYGVGQVTRVKAFWTQGQGDGGVWLCGDYLNHPWVEGAVRCGEKVAARLND